MNTKPPKSIVCFASGTGSLFSYVAQAIQHRLPIQIAALISDQKDSGVIQIAKKYQIPVHIFSEWDKNHREKTCEAITRQCDQLRPDLLVLLGFMQIFDSAFVKKWGHQTLNTHPSLLPAFKGAHGVKEAQAARVQVTGTTVHLLSEAVDSGKILFQRPVLHLAADNESTLHERIKAVEKAQILHAIMQRLF